MKQQQDKTYIEKVRDCYSKDGMMFKFYSWLAKRKSKGGKKNNGKEKRSNTTTKRLCVNPD